MSLAAVRFRFYSTYSMKEYFEKGGSNHGHYTHLDVFTHKNPASECSVRGFK